MGVPDCVTDIRLLFDPMALLITPRAMASGRSEFALPGVCPGPVAMNRFVPHNGITTPLEQPLPRRCIQNRAQPE